MSKGKKISRKIRYNVIYRFVQFLIFLSNIIPRITWLKLCGLLGRLAYFITPKTRRLVKTHLTIAFGNEKDDQAIIKFSHKVFEMLGKNTGEMLRATRIKSLADLDKVVVIHGLENYSHAMEKGKGVIFVSCHLGPFDLQVTTMALRGLKPNIIGTPLKNKRLNTLLWNYRNAYGANAIERGKETFRLIKALKSGGTVALLIDQDTKVKSRFVNFFGKPAATPVGATVLALKTGASVVPAYIYLGADWKQHMHFLPSIPMKVSGDEEADLVYNTQILTNFIEDTIRKHPEQWVWMHKRWKTKPGEEIS